MRVPDGVIVKDGKTIYLYCEAAKKIVLARCEDLPDNYEASIGSCRQSYNSQQDVVEIRMNIYLRQLAEWNIDAWRKALKVMHKIPSFMLYKTNWGKPFEANLRFKRSEWMRRLGQEGSLEDACSLRSE